MEVKSQGSDLEELWYLCPDPTAPTGPHPASGVEEEEGVEEGNGQSEDMVIHNHSLKRKVFSCTWSTTTVVRL